MSKPFLKESRAFTTPTESVPSIFDVGCHSREQAEQVLRDHEHMEHVRQSAAKEPALPDEEVAEGCPHCGSQFWGRPNLPEGLKNKHRGVQDFSARRCSDCLTKYTVKGEQ